MVTKTLCTIDSRIFRKKSYYYKRSWL